MLMQLTPIGPILKYINSSPFRSGCPFFIIKLSGSWEGDFKLHQCNFAIFLLLYNLGKDVTVRLNKLVSPSSENALCCFLLKLGKWSWKIFKVRLCVFAYFLISIPCKKAWPFFWTKSNTFYTKILCAWFGWNWSSGSGEDFWSFSMYFL